MVGSPCTIAITDIKNLRQKVRNNHYIFLRDKLADLLDEKFVSAVLACTCNRCDEHRQHFEDSRGWLGQGHKDVLSGILNGKNLLAERKSRIMIFALLIYIRYPVYIMAFHRKDLGDEYFSRHIDTNESTESHRNYLQSISSNAHQRPSRHNEVSDFADVFLENVYKFSAPIISDTPSFQQFHADTLMPFLHETHLRQGGSAEVWGFTLPRMYNSLADFQQVDVFALKAFNGSLDVRVRNDFHKEVSYLNMIQKSLRHDHIVQFVKAYQLGNQLNIILPLALGNLRDCLDEPSFRLFECRKGSIRLSSIWQQLLGLSDALHAIHTRTSRDDNPQNSKMIGLHRDLKPENILVTGDKLHPENYVFKIADFGLSNFKDSRQGSGTPGGTAGRLYQPPEALNDGSSSNMTDRRYDVWSLGCIFLEVIAFVVNGYEGVEKLKEACLYVTRHTENSCYFVRDRREGNTIVKPEVLLFSKAVIEQVQARGANDPDCEFLRGMLRLVMGINSTSGTSDHMVAVSLYNRCNSTTVLKRLQKITRPRENMMSHIPITDQRLRVYGSEKLVEVEGGFRNLELRSNRDTAQQPISVSLHIFEDGPHPTRLVVEFNEPDRQPEEFRVENAALVPLYAMNDSTAASTGNLIRFVDRNNSHETSYDYDISGQLPVLRNLHCIMTGRAIVYSDDVKSVVFKKPRGLIPGLFHRLSSSTNSTLQSKANDSGCIVLPANTTRTSLTIQLWREQTAHNEAETQYHMVIYDSEAIYLIPFHQLLHVSSDFSKEQLRSRTTVQLPLNSGERNTQDTFPMAVLKGTPNKKRKSTQLSKPAFPLDRSAFRRELASKNNEVMFKAITITFHDNALLATFYDHHQKLKSDYMGLINPKR